MTIPKTRSVTTTLMSALLLLSMVSAAPLVAEELHGVRPDAPPSTQAALAIPTGFSYQGRLEHDGAPASGVFDFGFELFDQRTEGAFLGRIERFDVQVSNGRFSANLDFDSHVFTGSAPWVQLEVRTTGDAEYTPLGGRQRLVGAGGTCMVDEDVRINGTLTVDREGVDTTELFLGTGKMYLRGAGVVAGLFREAGQLSSAGTLGTAVPFYLNADGGNVGVGTSLPAAPLHLPGTPDAEPESGGVLVLGDISSHNMAIDRNEIQARNNGATSQLTLNSSGGDVVIGGNLDLGLVSQIRGQKELVVDAFCPVAGTQIISGGCSAGNVNDPIEASFALNSTTWRCVFQDTTSTSNNQATAVCGRILW